MGGRNFLGVRKFFWCPELFSGCPEFFGCPEILFGCPEIFLGGPELFGCPEFFGVRNFLVSGCVCLCSCCIRVLVFMLHVRPLVFML